MKHKQPDQDNDTIPEPSHKQPNVAPKKNTDKAWTPRTITMVVVGAILIAAITWITLDQQRDRVADVDFEPTEVAITADGFAPSTILIPAGAEVRWVNRDTEPHQIASDPYPEADGLAELNSGEAFGPDSEYSFTFTEAGEYGYHDPLNPETTGRVVVVEE